MQNFKGENINDYFFDNQIAKVDDRSYLALGRENIIQIMIEDGKFFNCKFLKKAKIDGKS
jgi:hypothetical protein